MENSSKILKITASGLSSCQRCPRLLAYHISGEKNVWRIGIAGSGASFGKIFHERIAGRFHADAAKGDLPELADAFRGGTPKLKKRLAALVQARYFAPFLAEKSATLKSERLMALAKGTDFWIQCLAGFLSGVPSLLTAQKPEKILSSVFHRPEETLYAGYPYSDGVTLQVSGQYDCLLFNPDANEATLFEFKGYKASDVTVELSQTLVYAWLVFIATGIIPSVTLIYLENDAPVPYSAGDVRKMLDNLPNLFETTRQVL